MHSLLCSLASAPSLLPSARDGDVAQLGTNRLACGGTEMSGYSPRHMISSTEGFCFGVVFFLKKGSADLLFLFDCRTDEVSFSKVLATHFP